MLPASPTAEPARPTMKLLIDFLPVILFFVAYKLADIYVATGVAILAAALQVGWLRWHHGRVEMMPLATLGLLALFGGLTLALRDPIFVMWKPTLVNWLFGIVFLASHLIGRRPLVERIMGHALTVPPPVWRRLNLLWVGFFLFLGLANLFVVYMGGGFYDAWRALTLAAGVPTVDLAACAATFAGELLDLCETARASEAIWVDFKLFGMMGLTFVFVIGQALYLARHIEDEPANPDTE